MMLMSTSWLLEQLNRTFCGTCSGTSSFHDDSSEETDLRQYSRPCKREDIRICRLSANKSRVVYFVPKSKLVPVISSTRLRECLRSYVQEKADKAPLIEELALSPGLLLKTWKSRNKMQPDCDICSPSASASSPIRFPWWRDKALMVARRGAWPRVAHHHRHRHSDLHLTEGTSDEPITRELAVSALSSPSHNISLCSAECVLTLAT
jgi:hypothetical protein